MSFSYIEKKKSWKGSCLLTKRLRQMKLWNGLPRQATGDTFLGVFSQPSSSVTHGTGTADPAS